DDVVHSLKWGSERLAALSRDLFPDEPSNSSIVRMSSLAATEVPLHGDITVGVLRRWRWWRRAMWVGSTLAGVALVWLVGARPLRKPEVVVLPEPPTTAAPAPAPVAAPPVPTNVTVHVVTTPSGAEVFLDDEHEPRGKTPLTLSLPRSTTTNLHVTLRLRG